MAVCKYYSSKAGCAKGSQCRFEHVQSENHQQERSTPSSADQKRDEPLDSGSRAGASSQSSDSKISCRYNAREKCLKGEGCRFRHDAKCNGEESPKENAPEASQLKSKILAGALVKFDSEGSVLSIEPGPPSGAALDLCKVTCTWFKPSKVAILEFTSIKAMLESQTSVLTSSILERSPSTRTAVDKAARPWRYFVKVGNLDIRTSCRMLRDICKHRPKEVTFRDPTYNLSAEDIGKEIQQLLGTIGTVNAWQPGSARRDNRHAATATFANMDQAAAAVRDFNDFKLPSLGGSSIFLSLLEGKEYRVDDRLSDTVEWQLLKIMDRHPLVKIKTLTASEKKSELGSISVYNRFLVEMVPREVALARVLLEKVLKGHPARNGQDVIWDEFFTEAEGTAYLEQLYSERRIFVHCDAEKKVLRLYGEEAYRNYAESILAKTVTDLEASRVVIPLNKDEVDVFQRSAYQMFVERLGTSAVRLQTSTIQRKITIQGSAEDHEWARKTLDTVLGREGGKNGSESDQAMTCAICWGEVTEAYTTPCGHVYDRPCFVAQCLSDGEKSIPVKCLGTAGHCEAAISMRNLELVLSEDQLDRFLEGSFSRHVRSHPDIYQQCPTTDCDQIYWVSNKASTHVCPMCLASICTRCCWIHDGLTCDQYKESLTDDGAFKKWKEENDVRDCPKCTSPIEKAGGCGHINCASCSIHICWICMDIFHSSQDAYAHMQEEHGNLFE